MISIKALKAIDDLSPFKIDYTSLIDGWLNTRGIKLYAHYQRERWLTEGSSEGDKWAPLNPAYKELKKKKFVEYPGQGGKMMIATSHLFASVLPASARKGDARLNTSIEGRFDKLVNNGKMIITTTTEYASDVNENRNFTRWSKGTIESMKTDLARYLAGRLKRS